MIVLKLPVPPSVNAMYANSKYGRGRGRFKTKAYKDWLNEADLALWSQRKEWAGKIIEGPTKVLVQVPLKSRSDADNLLKAPIDFLVSRKVTHDDRKHRDVRCVKADVDCCIVTIEPCQVAA